MKRKAKLKAVLINPETETVQDVEIEHSLEALQKAVDGYIETVSFPQGHVMIVNEEGTFRPNFKTFEILGAIIHGPALTVGMGSSDFINTKIKAVTVEKLIAWNY